MKIISQEDKGTVITYYVFRNMTLARLKTASEFQISLDDPMFIVVEFLEMMKCQVIENE